ncbi:MAG: DNA cytosine methyltransferase [Anaerolineae bacterium]|nr:DNA cytosine methyltransferase [Anaerolineae bacterium]
MSSSSSFFVTGPVQKCVTYRGRLVLSLFPGIGLLDRAFEELGFCVVRGPDLLWGGDIRQFHPPGNLFWGIIGGSPCQEFSGLRRLPPTGYGIEMLSEFLRTVTEAQPEWWLLENVARVPSVTELSSKFSIEVGHTYVTQRFEIDQGWYCKTRRLRHIQFGSKSGRLLNVSRRPLNLNCDPAATANDDRSFRELCRLQGLPDDFDLPFKVSDKKRVVGNGVPLQMGRVLAVAVLETFSSSVTDNQSRCKCGCGRIVTGRRKYSGAACRKRAQRKRDLDRQEI